MTITQSHTTSIWDLTGRLCGDATKAKGSSKQRASESRLTKKPRAWHHIRDAMPSKNHPTRAAFKSPLPCLKKSTKTRGTNIRNYDHLGNERQL